MKLLLALLLIAAGLTAQVQSSLTGSVTDHTGAVIPGAAVVARNTATGVTYSTTAQANGVFLFPVLQPGPYELSCEMAGFKKFVSQGLTLETGAARALDIHMELGNLSDVVTVEAKVPLVESETSSAGQFIERATVFNMPVGSRLSGQLVKLAGNVAYSGSIAGALDIPVFSVAGGRTYNQMWHLDGGVVQNMTLGVSQLVMNPPMESLQEFRLESNQYAAEFGRTGGGLILMTTRGGTNEFRGAVYEFLRNDKLDARSFFSPGKAPLRYNIFGGSLGGPVIRNKTFFFVNYEGSRRRDGQTIAGTDVPHPAEINGDFSARRDLVLRDPQTTTPFPGNIIPSNRIDPVGQGFAKFYPAPNVIPNDITRAPVDNYIKNVSDLQDSDSIVGRADHMLNDADRLFFRYSFRRVPGTTASIIPTTFADSRAASSLSQITSVQGNWIHTHSPTTLNEFRFMWGGRKFFSRAAGTGTGSNGTLGLKGVNPNAFATIRPTGLTQLGVNQHERVSEPIINYQAIDNLTKIVRSHQIKMGVELRYSQINEDFNQSTGGAFGFTDRATGSGLASLLLGWTTTADLVDTQPLNNRSDYWAAYVQDDWKVSQRLTLNLGVRWELDTPRWVKENKQSGFDLNAVNPVSGTPGIVTFAGRDGRNKYAHDIDKNNVGPRVGFAFRLRPVTVIRGGYGISYNGAYNSAVAFSLFNGFAATGSFTSSDGGFTPPFLFRNGMPALAAGEEIGPGFGAVRVGQTPRLAPDFFQKKHTTGYSQQWNMMVQHQLRGNLMMEVAYLANVGHKLPGPDVDLNMIPLVDGRGPDRQNQVLRPYPQFSGVSLKSPPWGNSTYHGLSVKVEKRYSGGLNFLGSYTWSKYIDDVEAAAEIGGAQGNGYTHIALRRLDKALSGSDIRQRFVGSAVYELPFGPGRRNEIRNPVLGAVLGGWGIGTIVELRGGVPYGVIEQTNTTNAFSQFQRPNLVRDPGLDSGRSRADMIARYFDPTAFLAPAVREFGNAPRTLCCGPGLITFDLSANKRFRITERSGLQFRTDFFNVPNRPNFGLPALLRGRADFGRISASSDGRQIQFGLRYEF